MTTTELDRYEAPGGVTLFPGVTPAEVIAAATEAANALAPVIEQQKLSMTIAGKPYVLQEGWNTLAALTGAVSYGQAPVIVLPWPGMDTEPPDPGREPRRASPDYPAWEQARRLRELWDMRAMGRMFGFKATFVAMKHGEQIGSGEGLCTRAEKNWRDRDDFALMGMANTRARRSALRGPLGFVVSLAGYESTPAEDMPAEPTPTLDRAALRELGEALAEVWPELAPDDFLAVLGRKFRGPMPEAVGTALRAWAWWGNERAVADPERPVDGPTEAVEAIDGEAVTDADAEADADTTGDE